MGAGVMKPIYKSEGGAFKAGYHNWNDAVLDTSFLCNASDNHDLRIDLMQADPSGNHKNRGSEYFTLGALKK
jgi:hypothetical protein